MDFVGCDAVFDGPVISEEDARLAYGELRINVIGYLRGAVVFLTCTERGNDLHVISLRKATRHEIKRFATWFSR
ncbi:BrnT family toxin [Propionivibrio sp.]|uniref:BrnT family toxin n=1 Tax=Propionivibrio sp. TaxID=2212460 RepID=UPI003BF37933